LIFTSTPIFGVDFYTGVKFRHMFEFFNFYRLLQYFHSTFTLKITDTNGAAKAKKLNFTHSPPFKGGECKNQLLDGGGVNIAMFHLPYALGSENGICSE
jgi:hypothetical protein